MSGSRSRAMRRTKEMRTSRTMRTTSRWKKTTTKRRKKRCVYNMRISYSRNGKLDL